jgi:hypothetical protein
VPKFRTIHYRFMKWRGCVLYFYELEGGTGWSGGGVFGGVEGVCLMEWRGHVE